MPISCPQCQAQMPDNAVFCPGCGRRMWVPGQEATKPKPIAAPAVKIPESTAPTARTPSEPVPIKFGDKITGALAYVTFIPAVVFVLVERFRRKRFIRFHAYQSILLTFSAIVLALGLRVLYSVLTLIPYAGFLLAWLATGVALLGWIIIWLVAVIKALQGETFHLPVIGRLAERF